MEERNSGKADALRMAALLKEVQEVKEALEMNGIKEQIIANVMLVEDKEVLKNVAKAVSKVLFPTKPMNVGGDDPAQGNK